MLTHTHTHTHTALKEYKFQIDSQAAQITNINNQTLYCFQGTKYVSFPQGSVLSYDIQGFSISVANYGINPICCWSSSTDFWTLNENGKFILLNVPVESTETQFTCYYKE